MAEVFELVAEANRDEVPGAAEAVAEMLGLVGLGTVTEERQIFDERPVGASVSTGEAAMEFVDAEALLAERERARADKDYERADQIRDQLAAIGFEVRDSADGPRLVPKQ